MARRRRAEKRELTPDVRYNDVLVTQFINYMMMRGKRTLSEKLFYDALDLIQDRTGEDGIEVFRSAIRNAQPGIEVKSRRIGGATYQVPVDIKPQRRMQLAMRWLIDAARKRSEKSMAARLAGELLDASDQKGSAVKKKEETHRMAEANKAFSHYRW